MAHCFLPPGVSFRLIVILLASFVRAPAQNGTWHFAVSGDSRNCGDIVMPAIAQGVHSAGAVFYWHLGDFRAIYRLDQDYAEAHKPAAPDRVLTISDYLQNAWQDFIDNQLQAFGDTPVFLALGNHDVIPPKDHTQVVSQFADWLNAAPIREQRLRDNPADHTVHCYYHWISRGIDFITLDNALNDFEKPQMDWLAALLKRDAADPAVRAIVVGMHEALPDSISANHSMNQSPGGTDNGRRVYHWLLDFQTSGKKIFTLASHSHYFMEGIFNTEYWRNHGGVLPGWIVGTAGAERYALPDGAADARAAKTKVYGYLLATVNPSSADFIHFDFHELAESDVPTAVAAKYTPALVHDCWVNNHR